MKYVDWHTELYLYIDRNDQQRAITDVFMFFMYNIIPFLNAMQHVAYIIYILYGIYKVCASPNQPRAFK